MGVLVASKREAIELARVFAVAANRGWTIHQVGIGVIIGRPFATELGCWEKPFAKGCVKFTVLPAHQCAGTAPSFPDIVSLGFFLVALDPLGGAAEERGLTFLDGLINPQATG